jgi:2-succinyl-5-enolpyruvyl-6-hydroxy-3-cyclohexene-1-carboxylate synthase
VAEHADREAYERHVATPSDVDFEQVAGLAGLPHRLAGAAPEMAAAVAEPGLIEIRTDRADNVRLHREVAEAVAARL